MIERNLFSMCSPSRNTWSSIARRRHNPTNPNMTALNYSSVYLLQTANIVHLRKEFWTGVEQGEDSQNARYLYLSSSSSAETSKPDNTGQYVYGEQNLQYSIMEIHSFQYLKGARKREESEKPTTTG